MVDLMGYSVEVDNEEQARKLQEIAISQGLEWKYGGRVLKNLDERYFLFGYGGKKVIICSSGHYQDKHITKKAHFDDLFGAKFTLIAMKCTQEQFDAIKPKLTGLKVKNISSFSDCDYLVNNLAGERKLISNVTYHAKTDHNRVVHEEWNEDVFLKSCGIETENLEQNETLQPIEESKGEQLRKEAKKRGYTHDNFKCLINRELKGLEDINEWYYEEYEDALYTMPDGAGGNVVYRNGVWAEFKETLQEKEQRLLKELEEVRKEIEEQNKPKVGDWCKFWDNDTDEFVIGKYKNNIFGIHISSGRTFLNCEKITNPQLIELLENEMK